MINWTDFTNNLYTLMKNRSASSVDDYAFQFSLMYKTAIQSATTPFGNTITNDIDTSILQNGISNCLTLILNGGVKQVGYSLFANGLIQTIQSLVFNPIPPAPPTIAPMIIPPYTKLGINLSYYGDPITLGNTLLQAFDSGLLITNIDVATNLVVTKVLLSLQSHITSITGVYCGVNPTIPSPTPLVVPFTSLI